MNRSLKLSMLLALALGSTQAAALELGQIQVKSALGQPLLAEIPLTPESPAELRNLTARLASPEDFARAGLAGNRPELPLQFSIVDVGGRKVIRITSAVAVNDPYLDLLVEVDNASGRSLREFPVLLDPPGTAPMAAPGARAPRGNRATAPATAGSAAQPGAGRVAAGGQYQVERGQTLSGIARQVAPAGVDASQMMLALKQANPGAFYQDNINALKSGAVLRVPTSQEAQAMNVAAAMAEIRRQNGDWRAQSAGSATTVADAAARSEASGESASTSADRLALVPAKESGKGSGAQGGKGDAALRQDLMRSQETLTTLQQQSAELKSRLKDLQDINDKNTRLLALKDNEIAELQHKLAEARKKAGLPAVASTAAAVPVAPVAEATTQPAATTAAGATPAKPASAGSVATTAAVSPAHSAAAVPAKPVAKPASKPVKPVTRKPATPAAEEPWFMQPWVWGVAGGAVALLILLALLGRRRKPAGSRAVSTAPSLADRFGAVPDTSAPASADPDQDELLDQLAEHPDDIGLHLELVSLYYSRRDVEHFEAAAEAMHAHIVDPQQDEWQDVVAMGEDLVPGHPLFAGQGAQDAFDSREDERQQAGEAMEPFDLDSYASHAEETALHDEPADAERPKVSEYHFDFDLTPPRPAQAESPAFDTETDAGDDEDLTVMRSVEAAPAEDATPSTWNFEEPVNDTTAAGAAAEPQDVGQFSDDPIDTKLDLARAYMDMGDADGARAMLEEVMNEGTQMQRDAAQRLIDSLG